MLILYSMEAQHAAIGEVASKVNLRKAIKQAKKDSWVSRGSLDDIGEAEVPQELHNVILWMLKGVHSVKTPARTRALLRSASFISTTHADSHI